MGYYTRYTGSVSGPDALLNEFWSDAKNGDSFGAYDMSLMDFDRDILGGDEIKWYGWKDDMISLSKKYPALLFEIEGEGEESGDIWKAYIRNGNLIQVRARVVFDEPDLDTELPPPSEVDLMVKRQKDLQKAALDEQIADLQKRRELLGD